MWRGEQGEAGPGADGVGSVVGEGGGIVGGDRGAAEANAMEEAELVGLGGEEAGGVCMGADGLQECGKVDGEGFDEVSGGDLAGV